MMGAGKSTVGRRLAKRLELDFIDSDDAIEQACGLPAGEVFARYGEKDFRDGERRIIARLLDDHRQVIATGGGAFADEGTRSLLKDKAVTIWLDAPIEILAERTSGRDTRPLLNNDDPRGTLERLMEARRPFYSQADIRVRSGNVPHRDVVEWIVSALEDYLQRRV
ncbi:shikimate kinase [Sphingomonas piscis]|uniref:Shikimate kinase n=2 Tax=Sphingomonas piscis TaxID=2714943 RepID=A0A6G7YT15_9SPHN|nr:shikimate kinase [Sphingomonas piscis]